MKKIILSSIAMFILTSCASQGLDQNTVADAQSAEKQEKSEKSEKSEKRYRSCNRKTMGSRVKRC